MVDTIPEQRPDLRIPLVDGYRSLLGIAISILFCSTVKILHFLHYVETEWWAYHPEVSVRRSSTEMMFEEKEVDGPAQRDQVTASSDNTSSRKRTRSPAQVVL